MTTLIQKMITSDGEPNWATNALRWLSNHTKAIVLPIIGIAVFLLIWSFAASNIDTSLGKFPGPTAVATQVVNLYEEHNAEREKEVAFYQRQEERNAKRVAGGKSAKTSQTLGILMSRKKFIAQIFT
ncbi:hypothetical protein DXX93_09350 [Thalassotalea euphylliae]|uniref:Uncharacterized protein n=1 Tax=Thalassotalea euphylliae TaxID=1655234 RepID=A0A3E0TQZ3_9GAMM|nr:hypothetical protein [Thalassotalea euphylliae]REL26760.1 hypothetical protein DXX93_09350 [Thalassotalea euphylliae]